jgi:hypothetical protein
MAILGQEPYRHEAELALETTRRELAAALPFEIDDLTLCHGAAGAADALQCGAATLGGRWDDVATELGLTALERYGSGREWPCGTGAVTSPSLFRGLAGVGWWYLRLHDRAIPSPLAIPIG